MEKFKKIVIISIFFGMKETFFLFLFLFGKLYFIQVYAVNISSCQDLFMINSSVSSNFTLTNNINCSGLTFSVPLAFGTNFTGSLDGKGFSVSNLNINSLGSNSSLIYNGYQATVKNLILLDFTVNSTNGVVAEREL